MEFLNNYLLGQFHIDGGTICEYEIPVLCLNDLGRREKNCYARTLRYKDTYLIECNGCDDCNYSKHCLACIKDLEQNIRQKEA